MPDVADVVIIGGGIAGCATAYHLARRGVRVIVCERRKGVAEEQSGRNWGFVQQQGRSWTELPLMVESNKMWRALERELGAGIDWVQGGHLIPAADEARMAQLRKWLEVVPRLGLDTRIVSAAEVADLIPSMAPCFVGGLYTASDGHADPVKATTAFCRASIARGASVLTACPVESITTRDGAVTGVVTPRGKILAPCVVCAAGAWSCGLLRPLGLHLPRRLIRATVARTRPVPLVTPLAVWGSTLAFRQRSDGSFDLGAHGIDYDVTLDWIRHPRLLLRNYLQDRKDAGLHVGRPLVRDLMALAPWSGGRRRSFAYDPKREPQPNRSRVARSISELQRLFPSLTGLSLERSWAGYMDATPDLLAVLGQVPSPRGLVLATGFSGHGFGLGPIVGRLMAELIVDHRPSLDLHPFRFSRFSGSKQPGHGDS
jgi:glycine/D-amino acid oxidase-like deaminating enzyme